MARILSCAAFLLCVVGGPAFAKPADVDRCLSRDATPPVIVEYCDRSARNLAIAPSTRAYSWLRRGYALRQMGRPGEALGSFDRALALFPNYAEAHNGRGLALSDQGKLDDAKLAYSEAIAVDPDMPEAFNNRGLVKRRLGQLDAAIADYTEAIRLRSSYAEAFNNRGSAYYEKRAFRRAIVDFDEALRLAPDWIDVRYNRAAALAAVGELAAALKDFDALLSSRPDDAQALFNRGELYERLGDKGAAVDDWQAALASDPGLVAARRALERVGAGMQVARAEPAAAPTAPALETPEAPSVVPPSPTRAEPVAKPRRKVALVVGNGRYQHNAALPNPPSDAEAIARALRAIGFEIHAMRVDSSLAVMLEDLKTFAVRARDADVAVFFYAGHGLEAHGTNYLIPVDAALRHESDLEFEAIPLDRVLTVIEGAAQLGVIILDACRDNPFLDTMERTEPTRSLGRGLGRVEPRRGVLVAYAAKHGTVAYDGEESHSPYTRALLDNVATIDLDVSLLFRRVSDEVWQATEGRQLPYIYGSLPGEVVSLVNEAEG